MRTSLVTVAMLLVFLASPASVLAQDADPNPAPALQRGSIVAIIGASTAETRSSMVGLEIVDRVSDVVQAYAMFSYHDNVLRQEDAATLAQIAERLSAGTGLPVAFQARDRALGLTGGVKIGVPIRAQVRPYAGGGFGFLDIGRTISEATLGDVTTQFTSEFGAVGGAVSASKTSTTHPMAEALGGVAFGVGRGLIDVGYRYRKVFQAGTPFTFSQVQAGVGMRW